MSEKFEGFYLKCLKEELERRQQKNSRYSIRSFASYLEIDSSSLSAILKGKRCLPIKKVTEVCQKLGIEGEDRESFIKSVERENVSISKVKELVEEANELDLEGELGSRILIHWEYYAIFTLLATVDHSVESEWISKRLGIPGDVLPDLMEDLVQAKLVIEEGGLFKKVDGPIKATSKKQSLAHALAQKENLEIGERKLLEEKHPNNVFTSMTFTCDPSKIEGARKLISEFKGKMAGYMREGNNDEVYQIAIQLYPLSKED